MEANLDALILDCQNFETTLFSISKITQIDKSRVVDILTDLPVRYYTINDIWKKLTEHSCNNDYSYEKTIWFHGSRIKNYKSYLERGILPLDTIKTELINLLNLLSSKIAKNYSEPLKDFETCSHLGTKLMYQKGGPYANLVRDTFFEKDNENYDFLQLPEIVFDIIHCSKEFKKNANKLIELYLNETKSAIVKFYNTDTDEYYLKTASLYLFQKINNLGFTTSSNTCFDGQGQIVPLDKILNIEVLDKNYNYCPKH